MIKHELSFLVSSNPDNGAINISDDGSSFSLSFERPIIIPRQARNIQLSGYESTVWWVVPNIIEGQNDAFRLTYFDGVLSTQYDINIPSGLYDIAQLDNAINRELVNAGAPNNIITLLGDNSTQRSIIQINVLSPETISIDFTIPNNIGSILGFNSQIIPAQSGLVSIFSDNPAEFNTINYFLIHSDIVGRGIRIGDSYNNSIMKVPIIVPPGSLINFLPDNPIPIPCPEIRGRVINEAQFWLTDDSNRRVNTLNEYFSMTFVLSYYMPANNES
jgi:hypothetical protein